MLAKILIRVGGPAWEAPRSHAAMAAAAEQPVARCRRAPGAVLISGVAGANGKYEPASFLHNGRTWYRRTDGEAWIEYRGTRSRLHKHSPTPTTWDLDAMWWVFVKTAGEGRVCMISKKEDAWFAEEVAAWRVKNGAGLWVDQPAARCRRVVSVYVSGGGVVHSCTPLTPGQRSEAEAEAEARGACVTAIHPPIVNQWGQVVGRSCGILGCTQIHPSRGAASQCFTRSHKAARLDRESDSLHGLEARRTAMHLSLDHCITVRVGKQIGITHVPTITAAPPINVSMWVPDPDCPEGFWCTGGTKSRPVRKGPTYGRVHSRPYGWCLNDVPRWRLQQFGGGTVVPPPGLRAPDTRGPWRPCVPRARVCRPSPS